MRFDEALAEMRLGKNVKRKCWSNTYMFIGKEVDSLKIDGNPDILTKPFRETLYLHRTGSRKIYPVRNIATSCILGEDWEVVEG